MTQENRINLSPEDALEQGRKLPFAMVCTGDRLYLGPTEKWPGFCAADSRPLLEELEEARFYDGCQEIRLFQGDGGLRAACLCGDDCIYETYRLEPDFVRRTKDLYGLTSEEIGDFLVVAREIDFDEDGQAFVVATRLTCRKEAFRDD